jgi:hypothetical protein
MIHIQIGAKLILVESNKINTYLTAQYSGDKSYYKIIQQSQIQMIVSHFILYLTQIIQNTLAMIFL